jgi:hypothetical protein
VAACLGGNTSSFSPGTVGFSLGRVACVLEGAGQGWRRVGRATPCRCGCGVTRECTRACRNVTPALGTPGSQIASGWLGQGGVHDRPGAWASRGIERWSDGEAGGEVTAREGVSGVLTKRGIHDFNGDVHGRRKVARPVTAAWGRARGSAERREPIGGWPWVGVEEKRGRGFWQRPRPRAPLLPRVQAGNDKQRILP